MNEIVDKFKHKEVWSVNGKGYNLEVVRWQHVLPKSLKVLNENEYIWNIYCYIFPDNPLFEELKEKSIFDCPLDFHGGCTYVRWNRDSEGKVICKIYGNDYNHFGDEHIMHVKHFEDNYEVLHDVNELINRLDGE